MIHVMCIFHDITVKLAYIYNGLHANNQKYHKSRNMKVFLFIGNCILIPSLGDLPEGLDEP